MDTPQEHRGQPTFSSYPDIADRAGDSGPAPETAPSEPPQTDKPHQERYTEPVATGGDTDRPATSASSEVTHEPGPQPTAAHESNGRSDDQAAADESAVRLGLLTNAAALREQWQHVQGTFVDDPQSAVHQARLLVNQTLDEIRANVESKHPSETSSTDDLRASFQRYREFFQRLLSA